MSGDTRSAPTGTASRAVLRAGAVGLGAVLGHAYAGPVGFTLGSHLGGALWRGLQREADLNAIERALAAHRRLERADQPTVGDYAEARAAARDLAELALEIHDAL